MFLIIIFFVLFSGKSSKIKPINVWPYPVEYSETAPGSTIHISNFELKVFSQSKTITNDKFINSAAARYRDLMFGKLEKIDTSRKKIQLDVHIENIDDRVLNIETQEDYTLTVREDKVEVVSQSIFGFVRAMETFSQLSRNGVIENLPIRVSDYPRYKWRGLMVDIARHFLDKKTMKKILDGMSYLKLNFLHLHLVDAQSFPIEFNSFPELAKKGAYSYPEASYNADDLGELVQYAYERGIRIIPEIDVPGHAYAFGHAFPEIIVNCSKYNYNINNIPLNPIKEKSIEVLKGIFGDLEDIFPDEYVHLGGDEVVLDCLDSTPEIALYLKEHNMTSDDLVDKFMNDAISLIHPKTSITWQERALDESTMYPLPKDQLIEVWKRPEDIQPVLDKGFSQVINSGGWYIDRMDPVGGKGHWLLLDVWIDMYQLEIDEYVKEEDRSKILGGEACQWAEQIDMWAIFPRMFPKLSAVAERLWSPKEINFNETEKEESVIVQNRLIDHICMLKKRGIAASPIRPDYCPYGVSENDINDKNNEYSTLYVVFSSLSIVLFVVSLIAITLFLVFLFLYLQERGKSTKGYKEIGKK